jgi:hypothetical protein
MDSFAPLKSFGQVPMPSLVALAALNWNDMLVVILLSLLVVLLISRLIIKE